MDNKSLLFNFSPASGVIVYRLETRQSRLGLQFVSFLTKIKISVNIDIKEVGMGRIKSIGMAEARPKLTQLVDEVSGGGEPYLIVSGSKVKAVLLGINQYNDMVERLEELSDAAELLQAELEHEPTMPFEQHKAKSKGSKIAVSAGS